jgi:hypothetical protein
MTEPDLPVPIEEQEDTFLRNIHRLFFRPKAYFEGIHSPKKRGWLFVFALTYGVAGAIGRWDTNPVGGTLEGFTWADHWFRIIAVGIIGGLMAFFLGGMWYRFRLGLCGAAQQDKDLVRLVYLSSAQVVALPMIIMEIITTFRFPSPAAAAALPADESMRFLGFAILFQVWSYAVSYIGARTVFKIRGLCPAIWFLITPILFITLAIGGLYFMAANESAPSVPKADVSNLMPFSGFGMTFSYPGNWRVIESGQSPGITAKVEIEGGGGAYFLLQQIESTDSAESFSVKWVKSVKETISLPTEPEPFSAWGTLKGVGRRFVDQAGDAPYEFRLFVAPVAQGRLLLICETFPKAAGGRLEGGFKLIRKTFRMTS